MLALPRFHEPESRIYQREIWRQYDELTKRNAEPLARARRVAMRLQGENTTPTQATLRRVAGLSMPEIDPDPFTVMYFVYNVTARSNLYNTWFCLGPPSFGGGHYLVTFSSPVNAPTFPDQYCMGFDGNDTFSSIRLDTGRWMCHALRTRQITSGSNHPTTFHWDLPKLASNISNNRINNITVGSTTSIWIGGTQWTTSEGTDSLICGLKIFKAWLSDAALCKEATSFYPVLPQYRGAVWCVVPGDVRFTSTGLICPDISGHGRHFTVHDGANAITSGANPPRVRTRPAGPYDFDATAPAGGGGGAPNLLPLLGVGMLADVGRRLARNEPVDRRSLLKYLLTIAIPVKR